MQSAFDKFSAWVVWQYADTAATITLRNGEHLHSTLGNYLIALTTGVNDDPSKLILLEYYLTKVQFESVQRDMRKNAIDRIILHLNIPSGCLRIHYLQIANDRPGLTTVAPETTQLPNPDIDSFKLSHIPDNALYAISAARWLPGATAVNLYDIRVQNGQTIREIVQQRSTTEKCSFGSLFGRPYYYIDAKPVNGMMLNEFEDVLNADEKESSLGLFLVRQATLQDIKRYVKKHCVERLQDVTRSTWFLVSESVPFETCFQYHSTVHEVAYLENYSIVYWLRSQGSPTSIGKYFTVGFRNEYDSIPPAPGWLNVLVSNETDGSSTYLHRLVTSIKKADPFRMIACLQAIEMIEVLQQPDTATIDQMHSFFNAQTDLERLSVSTGQLLLLVDNTTMDANQELATEELIKFLNAVNNNQTQRITVWVVGNSAMWTRFTADCKHAAIKYAMPELDEDQRKSYISRIMSVTIDRAEEILESMISSNNRNTTQHLFGNLFFLTILAEAFDDVTLDDVKGTTLSCWWIDAMEQFVWKHIATEGSVELKEVELQCYQRTCSSFNNSTTRPTAGKRSLHRTVATFLAARYLAQHPQVIDVDKYRHLGRELIDLLLFRHSPLAIAVLQNDVESVRQKQQNFPQELITTTDCLQRNLLHIVHSAVEIEDILLSSALPMEQQCPQLNNWTPLHAAIDRMDWTFVDRLLAKGATINDRTSKLHTMSVSELGDVFCDCIAASCTTLIGWILEHRPDYNITQQDIYTLSVYEEFDEQLLFCLLTIAEKQRLPAREQPYRFIWGNSALDNAVENGHIELAAFLVERLCFEPTDDFRDLQIRHQEQPQLKQYDQLFDFCSKGDLLAVCRLMEQHSLDPQYEYKDTNLFIQAVCSGSLELVRHLYERCGFDKRIDDRDQNGHTAMHEALAGNHETIVRFLIEHGSNVNISKIRTDLDLLPNDCADIDTSDFFTLIGCGWQRLERLKIDYNRFNDGELLLHYYIRYMDDPDEATFRFLLSQYTDVDVRASTTELRCGETPLHLALQYGNKICRKLLLDAGADVRAKSLRHGLTSLHFAIMGRAERSMIQRLIEEYGIEVNTRDERGRSISFYMPLDTELYRWLVDRYQFDASAPDNAGRTVLHHWIIKNSFFVRAQVEYLLQIPRISQALADNHGRLALHYAVEVGSLALARLLLKYRLDLLHIPDNEGLSAVQLAQKLKHSIICKFFQSIARHN
ncbi:uncharacterized protein LOC128721075 [Anopheles nili]|uniref:uncharacterized protein LOC128721075 n=1 Tax=Anopheles nili TaxID=185578 RepID=UPI00237A2953|nr:uncharacterized protein LOC128721075 [Anopheles nili]